MDRTHSVTWGIWQVRAVVPLRALQVGVFMVGAVLIGGCGGLSGNPSHFPPNVLARDKESSDFLSEWYSPHLRSMGEEALHKLPVPESAVVYRFLYLPTFNHPMCIRVEWDPAFGGQGRLTVKTTSGKGGYETGSVTCFWQRELSEKEFSEVDAMVRGMGFWRLDTFSEVEEHLLQIDGQVHVVEGRTHDRYHVVWRGEEPGRFSENILSYLRREIRDFDAVAYQVEAGKFAAFYRYLFHLRLVPGEHAWPVGSRYHGGDWPWGDAGLESD